MTKILATILLTGLLISFDTVDKQLKDGYYTSSHGHATILFKIHGDNIEWYLDNVTKSWGRGKFEINAADSLIKISLARLRTSREFDYEDSDFEFPIKIIWDKDEDRFKLRDYRYSDDSDRIRTLKKRVKSSCKITAERPSL